MMDALMVYDALQTFSKDDKYDVEFEREKFYPGPGLEPGPLAFRVNALPTELSRTSTSPR